MSPVRCNFARIYVRKLTPVHVDHRFAVYCDADRRVRFCKWLKWHLRTVSKVEGPSCTVNQERTATTPVLAAFQCIFHFNHATLAFQHLEHLGLREYALHERIQMDSSSTARTAAWMTKSLHKAPRGPSLVTDRTASVMLLMVIDVGSSSPTGCVNLYQN